MCALCKENFASAWDLMVHAQAAHMVNIYQLSTKDGSQLLLFYIVIIILINNRLQQANNNNNKGTMSYLNEPAHFPPFWNFQINR
ncbi:hypothetical protein Avbf_11415 [Armadillidium vulgare]|nr:hypothetical protein Avbf_11415 [Armadillidium vulgare]